jgi:hypothetical protein
MLSALLRCLPDSLRGVLDEWSQRVARQRARRRRETFLRRNPARSS